MYSALELIAILIALAGAVLTLANRTAKSWLLLNLKKSYPSTAFPSFAVHDQPWVAFHLAISNEDPRVVLETLQSLERVAYDNYVVVVVDNNTADMSLWLPIRQFCDKRPIRFKFFHVESLGGYKAGALNYALDRTPTEIEYISIVDADTEVAPIFLKETIGHFTDKDVAIVQTPLGFKSDPSVETFRSWIFLIYRYFLSLYMPNADIRRCAPFIGAMGVLRRSSLEEAGRWNGYYLTEDLELSIRILRFGYKSRFIPRSYGFSMPPNSFRSFKTQHYRWNFGNVQVIRDHILKPFLLGNPPLPNKLLALAICPGIYLNVYLLSLLCVAAAFFVGRYSGQSGPALDIAAWILLLTGLIELLGDITAFLVLGTAERASPTAVCKNLASWWALGLNNAVDSARASSAYYPLSGYAKGIKGVAICVVGAARGAEFGNFACLLIGILCRGLATIGCLTRGCRHHWRYCFADAKRWLFAFGGVRE